MITLNLVFKLSRMFLISKYLSWDRHVKWHALQDSPLLALFTHVGFEQSALMRSTLGLTPGIHVWHGMIVLFLRLLLLFAAVKITRQNFGRAFTFFPVNYFSCDLLFCIANINVQVYSMNQSYIWVRTGRTVNQTGEENVIYALVGKKKQQNIRKKCFFRLWERKY